MEELKELLDNLFEGQTKEIDYKKGYEYYKKAYEEAKKECAKWEAAYARMNHNWHKFSDEGYRFYKGIITESEFLYKAMSEAHVPYSPIWKRNCVYQIVDSVIGGDFIRDTKYTDYKEALKECRELKKINKDYEDYDAYIIETYIL